MGWVYDTADDTIVDEDGGLIASLTEGVSEEDALIMAASRELYGVAIVALQFMDAPLTTKARMRESLLGQLYHSIGKAQGRAG